MGYLLRGGVFALLLMASTCTLACISKPQVDNPSTPSNPGASNTASDAAARPTMGGPFRVGDHVYNGAHDGAYCASINGWAWDRSQPNTPIQVDIYDANKKIATVTADQFRQDLLNGGMGNGRHGFALETPQNLQDGQPHEISVKFSGTEINLNFSPKTLKCPAAK